MYELKDIINKVHQGDCLEFMKQMPDKSVDLVLTDPPYRNEDDNQPTQDMRKNGGMENFGGKLTEEQFLEIVRISKNQIIWGCNNFDFLPPYKGFLVWQKHIPEDFTMSMAEIAYLSESLGTISKVFKTPSNSDLRFHPTQKPIELFKWILIKYTLENQIIFDPFLGSGTTAVAAKQLGRKYIGVEISPKYCEIARQRLRQGILL